MSTNPAVTKLAVFDIDNTLRRGYTLKDFAQMLLEKDLFDKEAFKGLEDIQKQYMGVDYTKFAQGWVFYYQKGIIGRSVADVEKAALEFGAQSDAFFAFSSDLVEFCRSSGYITVAISGSPYEPIKAVAESMKIDEVFATRVATRDGRYVAEGLLTTYITDGAKKTAYEWACYNHRCLVGDFSLRINHRKSLAFGDSEHDISFLRMVGDPVAIGPSQNLRAVAEDQGWLIAELDDDVVAKVKEYVGHRSQL